MIKGLGVDLVDISRMEKIIARWGDKFLKKIFTQRECTYCDKNSRSARHYAARFAAKEALLKMLGTGLRAGINWTEMEVIRDDLGKPRVMLQGRAGEIARARGINNIHISLSHEQQYAVAQVIGEGGPDNDCTDTAADADG